MNYMEEVAKILGVEIGEEFDIEGFHYNPCKFFERGLIDADGDTAPVELSLILSGLHKIKKKPWKPEEDEPFYFIGEDGAVDECYFEGYFATILYKLGNCYRAEEEAEANKQKWIDFYNSDEVIKC